MKMFSKLYLNISCFVLQTVNVRLHSRFVVVHVFPDRFMTSFLQINFLSKYKGPYQTDRKKKNDEAMTGEVTDI